LTPSDLNEPLARMRTLTLGAIAKDWNVSKPYVHRCVKHGCPTDSLEAARLWREAHASSKASTNSKQIAKQLGEGQSRSSCKQRPASKRELQRNQDHAEEPSSDQFADAVDSNVKAQREAWRLLQEAMIEGKDSKIAVRLASHTRSVEALIKASVQQREELERRRILIPLAEAMDMARRGYDVIMQRLKTLPQNVAARCNPTDPLRAMTILESECTEILAEANRVYAAWSEGRSP
jgi:hypothetical protein